MNEYISRIIPKVFKFILLVLISIFLLTLITSEVLDIKAKLKSKETVTFSGEGKAIGIPDIASVNFSVVTEKMTAKEVMAENAKKMNEVINFVKESGVDEKDIKTQAYYLSPRYDWIEGERISKGYELTSTLTVKVRDIEKISDIIDGAVLKGANQVGNIQFVIDDPEKLEEEARNKAIENAKTRADSISRATGLKIGRILSFAEGITPEASTPIPYYLEEAKGLGGETATSPEVEKGSQKITVNVSLTFELK
jgi:hypothetical protein